MWEVKFFNLIERIFQGAAKHAVNRLGKKEDRIYRQMESVSARTKSDIELAQYIARKAEQAQAVQMMRLASKQSDIETAYTHILKRAGV